MKKTVFKVASAFIKNITNGSETQRSSLNKICQIHLEKRNIMVDDVISKKIATKKLSV